MMKSRVSRKPDMQRLGEGLARPGMDTRSWAYLAVVEAFKLTAEGPMADITRLDNGEPDTVRIGAFYAGPNFGFYAPLEKDDEVMVAVPGGDSNQGGVVVARLWSKSDPPSSTAKDNNVDVSIHIKDGTNLRIAVTGGGKILMGEAGEATKPVARKDDKVDGGFLDLTVGGFGIAAIAWRAPGAAPPIPPPTGGTVVMSDGVIKTGSSKVEASD